MLSIDKLQMVFWADITRSTSDLTFLAVVGLKRNIS